MEHSVLFLTATAFIAVGANIVIQVDFKSPMFITYNDRTEVIEGDAKVTCIPPELCRADIQEDRIIVHTVPEVMRDLIETPTLSESEPDRLQSDSSESTTMTPWKIYKDEVKSKRKNRKKKDRKIKTKTTTTTTEETWFETTTTDPYYKEDVDYSEVGMVDSKKLESAEELYPAYDQEPTTENVSEETTDSATNSYWPFRR